MYQLEKPPLLSPADIARYLSVQERTVHMWLRNGFLKGRHIGKHWRVEQEDLQTFIESGGNTGGSVQEKEAQKREHEIALREGGYYDCFPEQEENASSRRTQAS